MSGHLRDATVWDDDFAASDVHPDLWHDRLGQMRLAEDEASLPRNGSLGP